MEDISSPSFACASPIETSISMDIPEDVLILRDTLIPLASLGEPEESKQYENDAGGHHHEYDDSHDFNVDEEECIVKETLLEQSYEEIVHEVPPLHV